MGPLLLLVLTLGQSAAADAPPPATPLSIERAVELALERNERARMSEERVAAAEARLWRARSFFFPELNVTGTYTRRMNETTREIGGQQVVIQAQNALSATAVARMAILDARGFPLHAQAAHERNAVRFEARDERRLLAFEAAEAFMAVLSADQVRAAAEARLKFAQQSFAEAKTRFEAQLVSSNDVTKAELELASAEREFARARGGLQSATVALSFLLDEELGGTPLALPEALLTSAASAETKIDAHWVAQAIERRLDLRAVDERVRALRSFALEPKMRLIPQLNLTGQYRVTNESGFSGRTGDGFLALELAWPLFDGGERYAEARERTALANVLALDAQARQRRVGADVQTAQVSVESAQAALRQAEVAAKAAEQNANEVQILYRQGLTSALEAADAGVRRFDAQVALARERYGLALAFLDLRAAMGLDPLGREAKE